MLRIVWNNSSESPWMEWLKIAPAFSALPTSDRHGWRKCNRIVGTILAMWVDRKLLLHFPHFPHLTAMDGGNAIGL
jgi:hypothetical protein